MERVMRGTYRTAARYALLEQARNRLAFTLLIIFVPLWYAFGAAITGNDTIDFRFRVTGILLHVNTRHLVLITMGLNAITLIVGFMLFAATRKGTAFDHRLVLSGYAQSVLMLAKLTMLVVIAALISFFASAILALFWRPQAFLLVWLGFFGASLTYGGMGLLLGVLVRGELEGFFIIIMVSLIDTFLQNPLGNPAANKDFIAAFPAYGPMQIAVAGGFTDVVPWRYFLLPVGWVAAFTLFGLVIFFWRTRAWNVHALPRTPDAGRPATDQAPVRHSRAQR